MANNNDNLPGDIEILLPWLNVVRRARQVISSAKMAGGLAAVQITVITDEYGNPLPLWVAPKVNLLEPRSSAEETLQQVIEMLTNAK